MNVEAAPEVAASPTAAKVEQAEADHACANCGAHLHGAFCHACGQKAHLHTRLTHLLEEFAEGVAHFDGRLWRTLPLLIFKPGRLSREWREGRRARYVPPLHVFLFAVFVFFFAESFRGGSNDPEPSAPPAAQGNFRTQEPARSERAVGSVDRVADGIQAVTAKLDEGGPDGKYYSYKATSLLYKLAPGVVPISMAVLWLLLARRRGVNLYDHAVVALYGLSVLTLLVLLARLVDPLFHPFHTQWWLAVWAAAFAHAVIHLHGAYRLSWPGAAVRGVALGVLSAVSFSLFAITVLALAVSS